MKEKKLPSRIMIVDNNDAHCYLFKEAVKRAAPNVEVTVVESGEKLIELLEAARLLPDIIFLDLRMPEYGGLVTLSLIRRSEKLRSIPVIIYTTSSYKTDVEATYHNGADLYIQKPIEADDDVSIMKFILLKEWGEHTKPLFENYVLSADYLKSGRGSVVFESRLC